MCCVVTTGTGAVGRMTCPLPGTSRMSPSHRACVKTQAQPKFVEQTSTWPAFGHAQCSSNAHGPPKKAQIGMHDEKILLQPSRFHTASTPLGHSVCVPAIHAVDPIRTFASGVSRVRLGSFGTLGATILLARRGHFDRDARFRFLSALRGSARRQPQCRGSEPCSPASCGQATVGKLEHSRCACRPARPSCGAGCAH